MDKLWLPTGQHWGLTITHLPRPNAGPFIASAPKLTWHTTEGTNLDGAISTLIGAGDEPHFVVSVDAKRVVQFIPLNRASKSLKHPPGTPETNHAGCIQVEICGYAADSGKWKDAKYERLAALAALIEHRTGIERASHVRWQEPRRIAANKFAAHTGHIGHMHVPNNDHVDPGTHFRIHDLIEFMPKMEAKFQ